MKKEKLASAVGELRQGSLARGYSLTFEVVSDSMRPQISPGDTVTIRKVSEAEIKPGDIIAWRRPDKPGALPVVHRVIFAQNFSGAYRFCTKGDHNPLPDREWITPAMILGQVIDIRGRKFKRAIGYKRSGSPAMLETLTNIKRFSWDMGYYCNFKCIYCFTSGGEWDRLNALQGFPKSAEEIERMWKKVHDTHGPGLIQITGGEPFEYPGFIEIAARLSRLHLVHVTTNLSHQIDALKTALDPARVAFNATFHPRYIDHKIFLSRVLSLRNQGFSCDVCYLAHPSQLQEMLKYRKTFLRNKINMAVVEFRGTWQGREYPKEYSENEKALIRSVRDRDTI